MASRQLHSLLRSRPVFSVPRRQPTFTPFRRNTTATATPPPPRPQAEPFGQRAVRNILQFAIFTSLGFCVAMAPATPTLLALRNPPSNAETLTLFTPAPSDDATAAVEEHIDTHPIVRALRADADLEESRPHLKIPYAQRQQNLTAGTLAGPGLITVPPLVFADREGTRMVQVCHVGTDVCGHPGIVHGGLLATLLDESLARCCFAALPHKMGMTANLNVNYRAPLRAGSYVVIRCETTKVEGRKAWVKGRIETLVDEAGGETPLVVVEADALFVSPKQAATMARIVPV